MHDNLYLLRFPTLFRIFPQRIQTPAPVENAEPLPLVAAPPFSRRPKLRIAISTFIFQPAFDSFKSMAPSDEPCFRPCSSSLSFIFLLLFSCMLKHLPLHDVTGCVPSNSSFSIIVASGWW